MVERGSECADTAREAFKNVENLGGLMSSLNVYSDVELVDLYTKAKQYQKDGIIKADYQIHPYSNRKLLDLQERKIKIKIT